MVSLLYRSYYLNIYENDRSATIPFSTVVASRVLCGFNIGLDTSGSIVDNAQDVHAVKGKAIIDRPISFSSKLKEGNRVEVFTLKGELSGIFTISSVIPTSTRYVLVLDKNSGE